MKLQMFHVSSRQHPRSSSFHARERRLSAGQEVLKDERILGDAQAKNMDWKPKAPFFGTMVLMELVKRRFYCEAIEVYIVK